MKVIIEGEGKEIADLVLAVQGRRKTSLEKEVPENERKSLIRQYERRLAKLKNGASPANVIF